LRNPKLLAAIILLAVVYYYLSDGQGGSIFSSASVSPAAQLQVEEGQLAMFFVDVGQGDCILVQSGGETMLVDTGSGQAVMAVLDFLEARDVEDIDYLLLTHAHEDHIGNAVELLRRYEVGAAYLPEAASDSATYQDTLEALEDRDVPLVEAWAGESFRFGGADCLIVSPGRDYGDEELNNSSIVLLLTYGETSFLLTGDAEAAAEADLLAGGWDIDADLLKVGHHGSATSSGADFLAAVSPDSAVVSLAADNEFGFPHEEVLRLLNAAAIPLYRTDQHGSVAAISDGRTIAIVTDR